MNVDLPAPDRVDVIDLTMAVRLVGSGAPIVLLHGNPTSSWLWRHCIAPLAELGRVIAPDLVGMGESDPLSDSGPTRYRFAEHRRYLDALLVQLDVTHDAVIVGHDWGGVLGFDWARRHQERVRGIGYMETMVRPRHLSDEPDDGQRMFRALRSTDGERMVLDENFFIDVVLAGSTALSASDLDVYRAPYLQPGESRRPTLTWAREIPFDGHPSDVHDIVDASADWLTTTTIPKLLIAANPGAIVTGDTLEFCQQFPAQQIVEVEAGHFVPEDAPEALTMALVMWIEHLRRRTDRSTP